MIDNDHGLVPGFRDPVAFFEARKNILKATVSLSPRWHRPLGSTVRHDVLLPFATSCRVDKTRL
jgi:hypothetical protein